MIPKEEQEGVMMLQGEGSETLRHGLALVLPAKIWMRKMRTDNEAGHV